MGLHIIHSIIASTVFWPPLRESEIAIEEACSDDLFEVGRGV
jgi:hypothetical protein